MALARLSRVLKLIGSPSVQQQAKMDVAGAIADADKVVQDYTKKDTWIDGVDHGFALAQDAAEKWAASRAIAEFADPTNMKGAQLRKEAMEDFDLLRKTGYGTTDGDNGLFYSSSASYKTIANDPTALRYRSRNAFGGDYD